MAKPDPNERPPPYYGYGMHTQPPLKPYEEVVNGGGLMGTPPSQPYYIPRYSLPHVAPPVTGSSTYPVRKKTRSCANNARCFGGLGAALLLFLLLGIGIWIGVRYGTKNAFEDFFSHESEDSEDSEDSDDSDSSESSHDTCINNTILCDATKDCQMGTDETNCVRFGSSNRLEVRTSQDGRFLPVCFEGWDKAFADKTCAQLGFKKTFYTEPVEGKPTIGLTMTNASSSFIQGQVQVSSSCPNQQTVSLKCIDCGRQQSSNRIIGGSAASVGQWPWQLTAHLRRSHVCGAVLISPFYAVTAAHCFPSSSYLRTDLWRLYGGTVSQSNLPKPYLVRKIILNQNYNKKTNDNDIALFKLKSPVSFNNKVLPACLPGFDQIFPHRMECWTSGFGSTADGSGTSSKALMEVVVNIIDNNMCNRREMYGGHVTKNMLCAGHLAGGKDACQGDSGGPLVCKTGDTWYLVGVTSWGTGCGRKNKPGVYTRVTKMLPWIYNMMQKETL
ncbi:transmembrane protease serine 13a isoform X2 [Genypterus blacodes]|uniref:transmembrane protease serine 13a isoform X2 n=1 Tax=Genypterus blacodes TaxID=154954 RepID=UPI003F76CEC2